MNECCSLSKVFMNLLKWLCDFWLWLYWVEYYIYWFACFEPSLYSWDEKKISNKILIHAVCIENHIQNDFVYIQPQVSILWDCCCSCEVAWEFQVIPCLSGSPYSSSLSCLCLKLLRTIFSLPNWFILYLSFSLFILILQSVFPINISGLSIPS